MSEERGPFSTDRDVFLIKLERQIDRGALISRYSRTAALDIRDVYDKEFAANPDRGREFYRRVFAEYGDESVSELVYAQMGVQNISNIASKLMEDVRIGLSFIEKSSRYVRYDKKRNGRYLYLEASKCGLPQSFSEEYEELCDDLFEFYASKYDYMKSTIAQKYPIEERTFVSRSGEAEYGFDILSEEDKATAKKAYDSAVRSRALDELRFILPASTLTNLGVSGNARSYSYLIHSLRSSGLKEASRLAEDIFVELTSEFPEILESSDSKHGKSNLDYLSNRKQEMSTAIREDTGSNGVILIGHDEENSALKLMQTAHEIHTGSPLSGGTGDMNKRILEYAEIRKNRRNKPPREFEIPRYHFTVTTNYGAFRDFHRHRMMTHIRGPLTCMLGYDTPQFISNSPEMKSEYDELMQRAASLWKRVFKAQGAEVAQYCVPYSYRYRTYASMDLREVTHFCELRSTPQAHPDLRFLAHDIYRAVQKVHPTLSKIIKFVDLGDYPLGRIFAEFRKEQKLS